MAKVVLLCGMTCSGKSSYAAGLANIGYEWLSVDAHAWELGHRQQPLPAEVQKQIKIAHKSRIRELVAAGKNVVLDYPLASRSRRDEYRALAQSAGATVELVYFDVPPKELHRRLKNRNEQEPGPHRVRVTAEQLDRWVASFEPPGADECPRIVH